MFNTSTYSLLLTTISTHSTPSTFPVHAITSELEIVIKVLKFVFSIFLV